MPTREITVADQQKALLVAATLAAKSSLMQIVRQAAGKITANCAKNDVPCQLQAIFDAVRDGTDAVEGLSRGVKYVRDPILTDYFTSPARLLAECKEDPDHCFEDCDGMSMLVAALGASIGIRTGLRAFKPARSSVFTHVYAVACPDGTDTRPGNKIELIGMDTTVDSAYPGWQPTPGKTMTLMLEDAPR